MSTGKLFQNFNASENDPKAPEEPKTHRQRIQPQAALFLWLCLEKYTKLYAVPFLQYVCLYAWTINGKSAYYTVQKFRVSIRFAVFLTFYSSNNPEKNNKCFLSSKSAY
jgi:hypothetical protein